MTRCVRYTQSTAIRLLAASTSSLPRRFELAATLAQREPPNPSNAPPLQLAASVEENESGDVEEEEDEHQQRQSDWVEKIQPFVGVVFQQLLTALGIRTVGIRTGVAFCSRERVAADDRTSEITISDKHHANRTKLGPDASSEWVVSVDRRSPTRPFVRLFDENRDLRSSGADGLAPDFLFGSYRQNPSRFSCLIRNEWDGTTLLRIVTHEL